MKNPYRQKGLALLLYLLVVLGVVGIVSARYLGNKNAEVATARFNHDKAVLLKAKEALLAYAVDYKVSGDIYTEMGRLPCPYRNFAVGEGNQTGNCGVTHANTMGLLPWQTLESEIFRDSHGECLWYVVSGDYKDTPVSDLLNDDSPGLIRIRDENGNFYHPDNPEDRPIAVIVAPGSAFNGQSRVAADSNMRHCLVNFTESNYLESGGIIDYADDHDNTADDIWNYLYGSFESRIDGSPYNDQLIWITQSELWQAVARQNDMEFVNSNTNATGPDPVTTPFEQLTRSLAQCVAAYGNEGSNSRRELPFAAPLDLVDYRDRDEYDDEELLRYGRLPQVIDDSETDVDFFIFRSGGLNSYCDDQVVAALVSPYDKQLWNNWKDHFFYMVSEDFDEDTSTDADSSKCNDGAGASTRCFTVDGKSSKVAAMVIFSGEKVNNQTRNWESGGVDDRDSVANYLEAGLAIPYAGGAPNYNVTGVGGVVTDYAYCVVYSDSATPQLSAVKCADL